MPLKLSYVPRYMLQDLLPVEDVLKDMQCLLCCLVQRPACMSRVTHHGVSPIEAQSVEASRTPFASKGLIPRKNLPLT